MTEDNPKENTMDEISQLINTIDQLKSELSQSREINRKLIEKTGSFPAPAQPPVQQETIVNDSFENIVDEIIKTKLKR